MIHDYRKNIINKMPYSFRGWIVLVAVVIVAVILTWPRFSERHGPILGVRHDIEIFKKGLEDFKRDNGRYPSEVEGLTSLIIKPRDALAWNGPYIKKLSNDPFGNKYIYKSKSINLDSYDLFSSGPDGIPNTNDDLR